MLKLSKTYEKIKTKKYILAYIDVLGTKEKVKNDNSEEYLNTIKSIYELTKSFCDNDIRPKSPIFPQMCYKIFSDNIIIAIEAPEEESYYYPIIGGLITFVSIYQATALYKKILTRGSITIGDLYLDDLFIYGKSLIEAVELEENVAFYPRVILSDKIKEHYYIENNDSILIDTDNQVFINYYTMLTATIGNRITNKEVTAVKNFLIEEYKKNSNNKKIQQKYDWLIQYHNSYVSKLIGTWDITEEHLIQPVNIINERIVVRNNSGSL
jgi:hypothetical protein